MNKPNTLTLRAPTPVSCPLCMWHDAPNHGGAVLFAAKHGQIMMPILNPASAAQQHRKDKPPERVKRSGDADETKHTQRLPSPRLALRQQLPFWSSGIRSSTSLTVRQQHTRHRRSDQLLWCVYQRLSCPPAIAQQPVVQRSRLQPSPAQPPSDERQIVAPPKVPKGPNTFFVELGFRGLVRNLQDPAARTGLSERGEGAVNHVASPARLTLKSKTDFPGHRDSSTWLAARPIFCLHGPAALLEL